MRIFRENAKGGRFLAPIAVNVKIFFTPAGRPQTEPLEIHKNLRFPPLPNQRWTSLGAQSTKALGFVLADTDGDRVPDTYVPGTSNFGVGLMRDKEGKGGRTCQFSPDNPYIDCHFVPDDGQHCVC